MSKALVIPLPLSDKTLCRFWAHVSKGSHCWLWTGNKLARGYGCLSIGGRTGRHKYSAHRLSWTIAHGTIPAGSHVLHNCPGGDNTSCVNPAHLFLGTQADNMQDAKNKGRVASGDDHWMRLHPEQLARGADHWMRRRPEDIARGKHCGASKLTEADVILARSLHAAGGMSHGDIASRLNVSRATITMILLGRTWKHLLP